jgi:hypothetical protein
MSRGRHYICVLILLYMEPHTTIYVSSYYYICGLILLYVSSYYYICVLILLYVSSYYYICVVILLSVSSHYYMCPHTTYYMCVLIMVPCCRRPERGHNHKARWQRHPRASGSASRFDISIYDICISIHRYTSISTEIPMAGPAHRCISVSWHTPHVLCALHVYT